MPKIRLSGTVIGADDPNRASRARLLYLLFANGWDIYNSNGDQRITLSNIERKIIESDAFVFTPGATLEDMFKAISIFVGFQTLDRSDHDVRAETADVFMYTNGSSQRSVHTASRQGMRGVSSLPGGPSGLPGSPFYFSLLPAWLTNESYPLADTRRGY